MDGRGLGSHPLALEHDEIPAGTYSHCNDCGTVHLVGPHGPPHCPAFLTNSGGGYTPPRPQFVRPATDCWRERRIGVIWWCVVLAFLLAALALGCCCLFVGIKYTLFSIEHGLLVKSLIVAPKGFYVPNDERIFKVNGTYEQGNYTLPEAYNTSQALDNVCAIPVRNVRWTDDWFMIANPKDAMNDNGTLNDAPEVQAFFAPDVMEVLPEALFEIEEFPKMGKVLEKPLDELKTVCLERMLLEVWAAIQELKLRQDNCICGEDP